jgi:phage-related holin
MAATDYITGAFTVGYNGELKGKVGFKSIAKKVVVISYLPTKIINLCLKYKITILGSGAKTLHYNHRTAIIEIKEIV